MKPYSLLSHLWIRSKMLITKMQRKQVNAKELVKYFSQFLDLVPDPFSHIYLVLEFSLRITKSQFMRKNQDLHNPTPQ